MMPPAMRGRHAIACLLVALFCTAASGQAPAPDAARMVEYDRNAPLDVKEVASEPLTGVTLHDISYASPKGGRVSAYLVVPSGKGPFPAILFQHWGQGNRSSFVAEALLYGRAGAVSLLVDAPFSRSQPSYRPFTSDPAGDRELLVQGIVDLRRGLDLLAARADVDPKRIAYVGLSYGANTGAVLAGVDRRAKTYILMGGPPSVTEMYRTGEHPGIVAMRARMSKEELDKYLAEIEPLDPIRYLGRAAPASLFLQFARQDWYVSVPSSRQSERAASAPKQVRWYDVGHEFNDVASLTDRAEWLRKEIGLGEVRIGR
jgi:dienelactone hydrolase